MNSPQIPLFVVLMLECVLFSNGKLMMSLTMKDLTTTKAPNHLCSKLAFNKCEVKFQGHVKAVTAYKPTGGDSPSKQDLWCEVLSDHKTCMNEVLNECLADYPILSGKIQKYLKDVVHQGCTHKGSPINKGCVGAVRTRRSIKGKTLYDLANECLRNKGHLEPTLQSLVDLLHNLNKSRHHLYKRLPEQ